MATSTARRRLRFLSRQDAAPAFIAKLLVIHPRIHDGGNVFRYLMVSPKMFTAFFDRSTSGNKAVTTVAGFVSRDTKWKKFESEWRSLLPENVKMFHMTNFVTGEDGWESWKGTENSDRRRVFIQSLANCILRTTNRGFAMSLRERHFEECNAEYKMCEHYGNSYVMLGLGCLGWLEQWAHRKGIPKRQILCAFEEGDEGQAKLLDMARAEGFNAIPQSKADIRAFDACDLAAWKSRTMNALDQVERLIRSPSGLAMLKPEGLRTCCEENGIEKRKT